MGCKAFTPHLVGLAKELEGQPFQLVASHNQRASTDEVLHEIYQNGLGLMPTNVTVTKSANHPGVTGTGYVPYYLLFDHHGDLVHHHQGGPYHGGDGSAVLDMVHKLLKDVPPIYLGQAEFNDFPQLAKDLRANKRLGAALVALGSALDNQPEHLELKRMEEAVLRHRDRQMRLVLAHLATDARTGLKELEQLAKALKGTRWEGDVVTLHEETVDAAERRRVESASKDLSAILKRFEKLEPVRSHAGDVRNPRNLEFRNENAKGLERIGKELEALTEKHAGTPAASRARVLMGLLSVE